MTPAQQYASTVPAEVAPARRAERANGGGDRGDGWYRQPMSDGSAIPEHEAPAVQAAGPEPDEASRLERENRTLRAELGDTRKALAEAEQHLLELRDRRSTEMARLERQAYWLERWELDLDRLMRRRPVRLAVKAVGLAIRALRRIVRALRP
jgi:hypothetical protein